jgi:hypothetical protein
VVIAIIEMQYVASRPGLGFGDVGFGLYLMFIGGGIAAASPWIPATRLTSQ